MLEMLKIRHIPFAEYRVQPWKNGKGQTREIAIDGENPYRWRVSHAELSSSGPFSLFEGYQRSLVLLGGSLKLTHGAKRTVSLNPFQVHRFSGDESTESELVTAGSDFNLFTKKGSARGNSHVTAIANGEDMLLPLRGEEHFCFLAEGRLAVKDRNSSKEYELSPRETLHISRPADEEYFDLKIVAAMPSRFLWVVIYLEGADK